MMNNEEIGLLALNRGDYQEAINIFRRSFEKRKTVKGFLGFGIANYNLHDFQTARWAFYKALELEPDNKEAKNYIAGIKKRNSHKPLPKRQSLFRAANDYLEIYNGKWSRFFIKSINLGLGLPGYYPGEYPVKMGTYKKWFDQISALGINAIRIYTVHPPAFYEALHYHNESGKKLYLLQGIWSVLPPKNNFYDRQYISDVHKNIKNAVDVIYGNAHLPKRPGYADGIYNYDVSPYTAGFIFGREWESCAVKGFNELEGKRRNDFKGNFLNINNGTPFEIWITETCDMLQSYEFEKYNTSHPLSVVNWPTLDPLKHFSESDYIEDLQRQGLIRRDINRSCLTCSENEDMESLDVTKISENRGKQFFATYHVYPYYPDFMNNDYHREENTYLAYLKALKSYHGSQPVVIGEFGVPSSREVSHWHRDGWHHGGHNEHKQGEINGLLMKAIYDSGMGGGIVFNWYDEWFKKNWLFQPYEVPAERNNLWFNLQDPEQNYGLLGTYPGYPQKKVRLAGRKEDWENAAALCEKEVNSMSYRFNDGFDDSRNFRKILVQNDEGFVYLLIEMKGEINFAKANYIIGLDTCCSDTGEFKLSFNTEFVSPVGLKFLLHFAGKEKSRILTCQSYDKYLNMKEGEIKPDVSYQGAWVTMQNKTNNRRISKNGKQFYPCRAFSMSNLGFGSLEKENPFYNSLADFYFTKNIIEVRIPWGLINFTDPSSKMVLWKDSEGTAKKTDGIKIIAVSYKPEEGQLFAEPTGKKNNITDHLPENIVMSKSIKTYSWNEWDIPIYHTYIKKSFFTYKEAISHIPEII
jgi:hypothetical protein